MMKGQWSAAQNRSHACQELAQTERLDDVIVCAAFQSHDAILAAAHRVRYSELNMLDL
jgi:hypothetical protein